MNLREAGVMGTICGVAWSMMLMAGGAVMATGAPFGALGLGGQYLAGHVLLGLGIGLLAARVLRGATRRSVKALRPRTAEVSAAEVQAPSRAVAAVAVLPVRPASMPPLRGRHAA